MPSPDGSMIELKVKMGDSIRGSAPRKIMITTTMPRDCGVSAVMGMRTLFVMRDPGELVTQCSGSGLPYNKEGFQNLEEALTTVEHLNARPELVVTLLQGRFRTGYWRMWLTDYFALLEDLDSEADVRYSDNEVRFRNLVFVFEDDELIALFKDPFK